MLALSDKKRRMSIAQVSHRTGIPRAACPAQPAHLVEARLRRGRRRAALLLETPCAVVQPRLSSTSPLADAGAADPRSVERKTARSPCSLGILDGDGSSTSPAPGVPRASCLRRSTWVDACRPIARPSATRCSRICSSTTSSRLLEAHAALSVHGIHAYVSREIARRAAPSPRIGICVREPANGSPPLHAGRAGEGHRRSLRSPG